MTDFDNRLNAGWWALRIGLGVGSIITGIDKILQQIDRLGNVSQPDSDKNCAG